ncbi:MAG: hypothetical protein LBG80_15125 [Bacteroidales bacterium]|jgi:hypothetical protein|nr:hypothetical protein [Bacteroidales bacterium]
MKVAIIGSGAYGSYIAHVLAEKNPTAEIHIYEVGNSSIKNESQIGYLSNILGAPYHALSKGRFFGYGGATVKWGGQLFTFSHNDFTYSSSFLQGIVALNEKYKRRVLSRFKLINEDEEKHLTDQLFLKTGIWLGYFDRNLFNYFKIKRKKQVVLYPSSRIIKLLFKNQHVIGFEYIHKGNLKTAGDYDHYFLTAGAFESGRILLKSGIVSNGHLLFSDHLSQRAFKIKSGTKIGKTDFSFKVKGTSLITKRMIGEIDSVSFYAHPIFNSEFPFFQNLKKFLFGRHFSMQLITEIVKDIPACMTFTWNILVKKRLHVYKNEWYLQIDMENPVNSGKITISKDKDMFEENGLDIDFTIGEHTDSLFAKAKDVVKDYLDEYNVKYEIVNEATNVEKYEDTYHPFGIYSDFSSIEDYFARFSNLLIISTGILPRAGGINSTCAMFPIIEEYVENYLK